MTYRDHMGRPRIAVTGFGVVTSLGAGKDESWRKLVAGTSGIRRISRFPTDGLRTTISGSVDFVLDGEFHSAELSSALAEAAIDEALREARIGAPGAFPGPLFCAVPPVEPEWSDRRRLARQVPPNTAPSYISFAEIMGGWPAEEGWKLRFRGVADRLADRFGTEGSPISLSTACASGATAIQLGVEAIRRGECEAALTVGTDGSIQAESLIRFSLLSALSTQNDPPERASKPFSKNRDGFVMAEGAAALVLESLESATRRGATILGLVAGCGERADSFHRTRSNPDGKSIIAAIDNALSDAGVSPDEVDYINAHGTSTPENDKMEHLACAAVFGERMARLPISSNKSMIGHTLTAAGAVEAAFSLMTLREQVLPPTINYATPDPALALDVVPNTARPAKVRTVMSNSFGFGGQNVALVFSAAP